ncbi:MAG TPA: hypothetical protein VJS89_05045 [Gammaproteobacteria bacterium]|nr:hypothetical protein [Gammaproteobacteria bacterium]
MNQKPVSNTLLSSLALLSLQVDSGKDYLDYFKAFVVDAIAKSNSGHTTVSEINAYVTLHYSLRLPSYVVDLILRRLVRDAEVREAAGQFTLVGEKANYPDITAERAKFQGSYAQLAVQITAFAASLNIAGWNDTRSEEALLEVIDDFGVAVLRKAVFDIPLSVDESARNENRYVLAQFVNAVANSNSTAFENLVAVVKGSMAANAVLYYKDPTRPASKVEELKVFLDTPFLLRLLGYEGIESLQVVSEAFSIAKKTGAKARIFPHTFDECQGVLRGVSSQLRGQSTRGGPYGRVFQHCIKNAITASTVERWANSLAEDLAKLGISQEAIDFENYKPPYSETKLHQVLQDGLHYREEYSLQRDLRSIAGIFSLRGNAAFYDIERAKAIFVTTNELLMSQTLKFFNSGDKEDRVPVVISDLLFINLLWVKRPTLGRDLPKAIAAATIASALNVPEKTWRAYLRTIDKLAQDKRISEDDVILLRYSAVAEKELLALTHGREDAVSEGSVYELLDEIRDDLAGNAAYRLKHLEESQKTPLGRLRAAISVIAWVFVLICGIPISAAMYFVITANQSSALVTWLVVIVPTIVFYIGAGNKVKLKMVRWLSSLFVPDVQ